MNRDYTLFLSLCALFPTFAFGQTCWDMAGKRFGLDPWWLFAIAATESSFSPSISSKNKNASHDLGLMQVNTVHLPTFNKMGITREQLQYDDCINIHAAAYLLRTSINKYGFNIDGIGAYHSNTFSRRRAYGAKVIKNYNDLTRRYYVNKEPFSFEGYKKSGRRTKPVVPNNVAVIQTQTYAPLHSAPSQWQFRKNQTAP